MPLVESPGPGYADRWLVELCWGVQNGEPRFTSAAAAPDGCNGWRECSRVRIPKVASGIIPAAFLPGVLRLLTQNPYKFL